LDRSTIGLEINPIGVEAQGDEIVTVMFESPEHTKSCASHFDGWLTGSGA
jgi:hypothetical protein